MARRLLILQPGKAAPCGCRGSAMLMALGAVSTALDVLQSLTSSKSSSPQSTGFGQSSTNPFDFSGSGGPAPGSSTPPPWSGVKSQLSPATMSALLAAQSQSSSGSTASPPTNPPGALKHLFSQLDANRDGQISKSEFENALGAGGTNIAQADDVFSKLDKDGSETVSLDEMSSALKGRGHRHHDPYNVVGQMMAREAQASSVPASLSVSV